MEILNKKTIELNNYIKEMKEVNKFKITRLNLKQAKELTPDYNWTLFDGSTFDGDKRKSVLDLLYQQPLNIQKIPNVKKTSELVCSWLEKIPYADKKHLMTEYRYFIEELDKQERDWHGDLIWDVPSEYRPKNPENIMQVLKFIIVYSDGGVAEDLYYEIKEKGIPKDVLAALLPYNPLILTNEFEVIEKNLLIKDKDRLIIDEKDFPDYKDMKHIIDNAKTGDIYSLTYENNYTRYLVGFESLLEAIGSDLHNKKLIDSVIEKKLVEIEETILNKKGYSKTSQFVINKKTFQITDKLYNGCYVLHRRGADGYRHQSDEKVILIDLNDLEFKTDSLQNQVTNLNKRFDGLKSEFSALDERFVKFDKALDGRIEDVIRREERKRTEIKSTPWIEDVDEGFGGPDRSALWQGGGDYRSSYDIDMDNLSAIQASNRREARLNAEAVSLYGSQEAADARFESEMRGPLSKMHS